MQEPGSVLPVGVSAEAVREQLERILESDMFAHSTRLSRFLRFTVAQALDGRSEYLKEHTIGVHVFDRTLDFDPRTDSIVRVEARRLRSKLERYYTSSGRKDPIVILFRKGRYWPVIRLRESPVQDRRGVGFETVRTWKSIAVLPFRNLGGAPGNDYLPEGVVQELVSALTKIENLRVAARTSLSRFRGEERDAVRAGEELGADMILDGAISVQPGSIHTSATLTSVRASQVLWSDSFETEPDDLLRVQEKIAANIVRSIAAMVSRELSAGQITTSPAILRQERIAAYMGRHLTEKALRSALARYEAAAARAPGDGRLNSGIAECWLLLAFFGRTASANAAANAGSFAAMALESDSLDPAANAVLSVLSGLPPSGASGRDRHLKSCLSQSGRASARTLAVCAQSLACAGRLEEAVRTAQAANDFDPVEPYANAVLGELLWAAGFPDMAISHLQESIEIEPGCAPLHWALGLAASGTQDHVLAIRHLEVAWELSDGAGYAGAGLAHALAIDSQPSRAFELLHTLEESAAEYWFERSFVHLALGDIQKALESLLKAIQARSIWYPRIYVWPQFSQLRSHPQIAAAVDTSEDSTVQASSAGGNGE
ncbi:MAG: hypothetical protein HUU41_19745 [Bryobacteraceae bacterium]|nr:hypothetical protein [Bryobacterales bacterium]NUN03346.1 hypothetical protein [Bryobacteraceae bacterium]